ncbi:MAG: hypothetical protein JO180_02145 [Gemmatirosa sp.]|nr:hypothetical protein [Gemmatirosa sp.]
MTDHDEPETTDERPTAAVREAPREAPREVPRRGFARRHWKGLLLTVVLLGPAGVFAAWTTATLAYSYSSGRRAGYNQKISRKGWICKTWEGELAVSSVPGVAPEIFRYSVRSDSVAHAIEALAGERVTIFYDQHGGVPTSCFGETEYFATGVEKAGS